MTLAGKIAIRAESLDDVAAIRGVHARAFDDPERVPGLVDILRTTRAALEPMSFVAVMDGSVIGHVMLSACRLDAEERIVDVMSLSPLGVGPEYQREGVGTSLVEHALAQADAVGIPLIFLEGSPAYYSTRGFERASRLGFRRPSLRMPEPAFQVARLSAYEPWMIGTFVYSDAFWACDCVGIRDTERRARIEAAFG